MAEAAIISMPRMTIMNHGCLMLLVSPEEKLALPLVSAT